jgi:hypothetical protein
VKSGVSPVKSEIAPVKLGVAPVKKIWLKEPNEYQYEWKTLLSRQNRGIPPLGD